MLYIVCPQHGYAPVQLLLGSICIVQVGRSGMEGFKFHKAFIILSGDLLCNHTSVQVILSDKI